MLKQWGVSLALGTAVLGYGIAVAHAQAAPPPSRDALENAVTTSDAALVPLPAIEVCKQRVDRVVVSPNRKYALILRWGELFPQTPPPANVKTDQWELELLLWGPGSRRATTVWRQNMGIVSGSGQILNIAWFPKTDIALATVNLTVGPLTPTPQPDGGTVYKGPRKTLVLRINAAKGTTETVATFDGDRPYLAMSVYDPLAAVPSEDGLTVTRFTPTGTETPSFTVPKVRDRVVSGHWSYFLPDGRLFGGRSERDAAGRRTNTPLAMDLTRGTLTELSDIPPVSPPPPLASVPYKVTTDTPSPTTDGRPARAIPLYLESAVAPSGKRSLLTLDADAKKEVFSLTSAVLYQRQGTLIATPLSTMPLKTSTSHRRP